MSRRLLSALAVGLLSGVLATTATAEVKSFKGQLVKDRVTEISIEYSGFRVLSYQFNRPLRKAKLFKDDGPTLYLTVVNEASEPQNLSIGVAIFDQTGNLVGVSAEESGKLKPGETKEIELNFAHLNRYAKHASVLQMSLEVPL